MVGKERPRKKGAKHNPLGEDLDNDKLAASSTRVRTTKAQNEERYISHNETKKIIGVARKQLQDDDEAIGVEEEEEDEEDDEPELVPYDGEGDDSRSDADSEVVLDYDEVESQVSELGTFEDLGDQLNIDDEEGRLLEKFQPATGVQSRNLADIIMTKIKDQKVASGEETDSMMGGESQKIDKRVVKVYAAIGAVLKSYTSGKIPKAFKVLPHVQNWEQLILLTRPHDWSPHATYSATRIFASALNERMAQRFYSAILLPIIHTEIEKNKKLHPAQYMAVRKALFKPVAFFKGMLLPLITEAEFECTLKEALIIGSILQKSHLPPIPTAVTLVKICEAPFSSAQCVILRIFIDKKMALPYQCVDALVLYFHRFCSTHSSAEQLPVLWHQTFLLFVTYYKNDFNDAQLNLLKQVCTKHFHHHITPEVRREIAFAQGKKSQYH